MLTTEENELVTRVGRGTPMGTFMREYWIPSALSSELPAPDCPPVRIRILGEDLIAFRATSGEVGVVANSCPHRGASMFFGRNEEEGLRCVYHGWKFDVTGACIDMPSEPPESNFRAKVRITAYPTRERGGLIWIYMGQRSEPPPLPSLVANMQPEGYYRIGVYMAECNWLQSLEGDFDTIHSSFLHRGSILPEEVTQPDPQLYYYTQKTRWARHAIKDTDFGCTSGNNRPADEGTEYWRIAQFLYPFFAMPPGSYMGTGFIAVVPIDDEHCIRFHENVSRPDAPAHTDDFVNGRPVGYAVDPSGNTSDWLGRFRIAGNRQNDYLIDRDVQRANKGLLGYSGIPGRGQDQAVTESMGIVYQRDHEHLGVTDSGIIRMRRLLIKQVRDLMENGGTVPAVDNPDLYQVTTVCTVLPEGADGIESTQDLQWKNKTMEAPLVG